MKTIILILVLFASTVQAQKSYRITRFEETATSLFVCLNSEKTPCIVEHFFTPTERTDDKTIKATLERLVAELQIKDDAYRSANVIYSKESYARKIVLDTVNIRKEKRSILSLAKLKADSIAKFPAQPPNTNILNHE